MAVILSREVAANQVFLNIFQMAKKLGLRKVFAIGREATHLRGGR